MQIDAFVDEMQDLGDLGPGGALPPPLPPKKPSAIKWVLASLVVLVAAGLGIGAGWFFFASDADGSATAPAVEEPIGGEVLQLDEVVFGGEPNP